MTFKRSLASLADEYLKIADRVGAEALEAIRPQLQELACQYTAEQVWEKLQSNTFAVETDQLLCEGQVRQMDIENFLMEEILEQMNNPPCRNGG